MPKYMDEKRKKAYEKVLDIYVNSGKNITDCCKEIGIHPSTFYKYRKEFSNDNNNDEQPSVTRKPKSIHNIRGGDAQYTKECAKDKEEKLLGKLELFFSRKHEHTIE